MVAAGGCSSSAAPDAIVAPPEDAAVDAGEETTGGGAIDANACRPADVQRYSPPPYHAATGAYQGACQATGQSDPIALFYDECLGPYANKDACAQLLASADVARCAKCILTSDLADRWGPIVQHEGFLDGNVAGCVELTDPAGLTCAKSVQAFEGCQLAACEANCPVHDAASFDAYAKCADEAAAGGCQSYGAAALDCATGELEAGAASSVCFAGKTFRGFYDAVVPIFCGPRPSDAGAPMDSGAD